ncbi:MAG: cobalamin-binding protein [Thermodesulfobacteriota bacterium]|nr:cobalamin-binding protein [Thermodesulfobacteriota bacterium]
MHKNFVLGIIFILLFSAPVAATDFTDAVNRQVSIPHSPHRVVSLVPSVTEILYKLGREQRIVAVTDFCTYPEAALQLPKVGGYADPSLESILLQQPDLVIAAADMNRPALVRRLELMEIPVYVVHPQTVAETLTTIKNIGQITGAEKQSQHLVNSIEKRIQRVQRQIAKFKPPTTLECVMLQPLTVAGPDTFIADIIDIAGGQNVVPKGPSRYPTWNTEALLTVNPEFIIVSTYPGQPTPKHYFDHWPQLQAVRNQQIIEINADWIHRPGPRMILGIEALAKALHPSIIINE